MTTWFVTGAGRGLGASIVEAALAAGNNVVATARSVDAITVRDDGSGRLLRLALDVTDKDQADAAIAAAEDRFGGVDVLVNNAGYGQLGPFEEHAVAEVDAQYAVNVFGLFHVTRAALPGMRRRRNGHIINISSIAGLRGGVNSTLYSSSKFAVEGFSEALSNEVGVLGIKVTVVEPGFFRTDFLDQSSMRNGSLKIDDYAEAHKVRDALAGRNHKQAGDPDKLAQVMVDITQMDNPPFRLLMGTDAVGAAQAKIDLLQAQLNEWRHLSVSTDFADA